MVGYFDDTPGNTLKLVEPGIKPTGGSNVWGQAEIGRDHQYKLPVINIGREDGLAIKNLLKEKELKVRLIVKRERKVSTTQNVVGLLPGCKLPVLYNKSAMCIRTKIFTNKDGSTRTYLYIVQGKRVGNKIRQQIVANIGRLEELQKGSIERLIEGLTKFSQKQWIQAQAKELSANWDKGVRTRPDLQKALGGTTPGQPPEIRCQSRASLKSAKCGL